MRLPALASLRRLAAPLRRAPLIPLLAAVFVALAALAGHAWKSETDRRAAGDMALREYAAMAAWEFASRVTQETWTAATELLRPVERVDPSQPLPAPSLLAESQARVAACSCAPVIPAAYFFRIDLPGGALHVAGDSAPSDPERQWLVDTVTGHAGRVFDRTWRVATVVGSPAGAAGGRTIAYAVVRDAAGTPVAAYGVASESRAFVASLARSMSHWSLLPPSVLARAGTDTLVSVLVRDGEGRVVWQSASSFTGAASVHPLPTYAAGFEVEARLRGDAAPRLVPAGDGSRVPVLLGLTALAGALLVAAIRQMRREAALARLRADFVASVSHELRTPLAQIRMFAELLRMGWTRSEGERTRSLEIIEQESQRLALLVERVLAFEGSGRALASPVPVRQPLAPIVRGALESFAPLAASRGVRVRAVLDENVTAPVDRDAIHQVLTNLLDNAVKYGPAGQTLVVGLRARGSVARLWVDDEGPGIPERDRAAVWEPFRRLARDERSSVAGSGIGLSVVRALAAAHGGTALVEAAPGGGARFVVELPGVAGAAQLPAAAAPSAAQRGNA